MSFQEQLKQIRELSGLNENVKSLLERMTGKELVSYEGIDALVAALMTFYNGELKKKAPSSHTHDDRYYTESEINEKFKNFCPFPINSLYLSLGSENPSSLWLGTSWSKIEGRFLLGASSGYGLHSTGGKASISLAYDNMPRHRHKVDPSSATIRPHKHKISRDYSGNLSMAGFAENDGIKFGWTDQYIQEAGGGTTGSFAPYTDYQGNGSAFSIMPPYIAVNIWKRLS